MKSKKLFISSIIIFLFANFNLVKNAYSSSMLTSMEDSEVFKEFFEYELNSNIQDLNQKRTLDIKYYYDEEGIVNFSTTLPEQEYNYCKEIEFSFLFKKLLFYNVHCCTDKIDVISEFNKKLKNYSDKSFEDEGYYIWKDESVYVIYNCKNGIVTIGKNSPFFFFEDVHKKSNYSPFYENGEQTELYKKYQLNNFPFYLERFDFYLPYIKDTIKIGEKLTYATLKQKNYYDVSKYNTFCCNYTDSSMECKMISKRKKLVHSELEMLFFGNLLMSYSLFFKNGGKYIIEDLYKRYGKSNYGSLELGFGVWEGKEIKIVAIEENKHVTVTIFHKCLFNIACNYMSRRDLKYAPEFSKIYNCKQSRNIIKTKI